MSHPDKPYRSEEISPVADAVCSNICIIRVCTQELWFQIKGGLQFGLLSVFNRKIVFGGQEWNSFLFRYKCIFVVWSFVCQRSGLHRLWYATIRDTSTWSKFGAHGEHGDVFMFSNLGALWFSENLIRYSLHICLREVKNNFFSWPWSRRITS